MSRTRTTAQAARYIACAALLGGPLISCRGTSPDAVREGSRGGVSLPSDAIMASIPVGDIAGVTPNNMASTIPNPYTGNRAAVEAGQQLFIQMNCVGCHGYDLHGGMGPNLTDTYWRYGGAPAQIYKSIFEGRPQGMPAWGRALTRDEIWKVVAYIQAQGGSFPASLANAGLQGNLGDKDTTAGATLKGRQNEH